MVAMRAAMRMPKRLPSVAPTIVVWCFSLAQRFVVGGAVAVVVVRTSVADGDAVGVWRWSVAVKVVVTLGAAALLQQLRRSVMLRQQYLP
jgi:hypothetical protein